MPIYEYQCQSCEQQLEALRKISDEPLVTCPECGKDSLTQESVRSGLPPERWWLV